MKNLRTVLVFILWIIVILVIEFTVAFIYFYQAQIKTDAKINYIFDTLSDESITNIDYEKNNN